MDRKSESIESLFAIIVFGFTLIFAVIFVATTTKPPADSRAGIVCNNCSYDVSEKPSYMDKLFDPISVFTLFLVVSTILLWISTRRLADIAADQAEDMKRSIRVAEDAARVAKSSLVDTERAFVFSTQQNVIPPLDQNDPNGFFLIQLEFSNKGKTWTQHCRCYSSWKRFYALMPDNFDFVDERPIAGLVYAPPITPGNFFIGPNGSVNLGPVMIPRQNVIEALEGRSHVYIWAWCEYDDVFDNTPRHRTELCLKLQPMHAPVDAGEDRRAVTVALTYHTKFNGADGDCLKPIQTGSPKNPLPTE